MQPLLAAQTDARLVALTRAGNERAFEAIVNRYRAPLVRYAARFLPASRAEDAVQQAFMNAYEALGRSDAAIELKPWLYRITHNASLNLLRQNGWDYDEIPPDFDGVMRPDQAVELGERLRQTFAAVQSLPDRQRDAIILRELEGRSYEEIAVALGTGDGAVRQLLNRARAGMRATATVFTPWPLVARAAGSPSGANVERTVEVAGAAGLVKVGAAALATAAVVGGTVAGPIDLTTDTAKPPRPAEAVAAPADGDQRAGEPPRDDARSEERPTSPRETNARREDRRGRTRSRNRGRGGGETRRRVAADEDEREDRSGPDSGEVEDEVETEDGAGDAPEAEDDSGSGSGEEIELVEHQDNSGSGSGEEIEATTLRTGNSAPGSIDSPDGD